MKPSPSGDPGPARHRIVVVGGGAAGLELATALGERLGRRGKAEVTLVERARTHLWKPLLHAVAAGSMDPEEHALNYLAQAHWHCFRFRWGEMIGLDRAAKQLRLAPMRDAEGQQVTPGGTIGYDTLVVAIGSVTNDFGTSGAADHAVPLDTPEQAVRFNRRLVNACIRADVQPEPVRPGQLHVAIIGAGATGTELAAELHRTVRQVVAFGLTRIDPARDIRIILLEAADRILPGLPPRISAATMQILQDLGIDIRTGARVSEVLAQGVRLADGDFIPAEMVVWSAGVKAPEVLRNMDGLEVDRINRLVVEPTLQTTQDPNIFAIGDCASCPWPGHPGPVPPRAQAAHQQASHLARQLIAQLRHGTRPRPFVYRDFGSLVSLGRHHALGTLMGGLVGKNLFIEGLVARLMYRSLYTMHQHALHGTGRVMADTATRLVSRPWDPRVKLH